MVRRFITAAIIALAIGLPAAAQFSFRTTGEGAHRIFTMRPTASSLGVPPLSDANHVKFWVPDIGHPGYSAGNIYISQNAGPWTLLSSFVGSGAVSSVFNRTGAVQALVGDYAAFYVQGQASSVDSELALFSGTGGKAIKRATGTGIAIVTGGVFSTAATSAGLSAIISDETGSGALVFGTSPTLTTPAIASFVSAGHTHQNSAGGGTLDAAAIGSGILSVPRGGTGATTSSGSGSVVLVSSPALTGTPTAPTAAASTNTTQIATTAFVQSETLNQTEGDARYAETATGNTFAGNQGIGGAPETILHLTQAASGAVGPVLYVDNPATSALNNKASIVLGTSAGANTTTVRTAYIDAAVSDAGTGATYLSFGGWTGVAEAERLRLDAAGNATITGTLKERNRSAPLGEWTGVTFNAGNFTAAGGSSATWVLAGADQATLAYSLVGKTMSLAYTVNTSTVTGSPTSLRLAIPGGFTANRQIFANAKLTEDNASFTSITASVNVAGTVVVLNKDDGAAFANTTDLTGIRGQIVFEIQ